MVLETSSRDSFNVHVCLEIGKKNLKCKTWENGVLEQNHGLSENVALYLRRQVGLF